ncbi:MAG: 4'-phosphopantetheinyl transferase superfamily protein [Actinomycetota bacterium]|nr:4'-phosphopantetheinyl transferase superfamily protein [Actinomycetota bacterium]
MAELAIPEAGAAHVWWARRQDASARHEGLLDDVERQRWTSYRQAADRERFLVGCSLAKTVLAAYAGQRPADVRFDRTCGQCGQPHGKPILAGGGLAHSVSHSGDLVAVAVAADPVGVDVEQLDDRVRPLGGDGGDPRALATLVFSAAEQASLDVVPPADRGRAFLVGWTRKEAVTKATGDGVRAKFSDVVVAGAPGAPRLVAWPYPQPPQSVSLLDLEAAPGYVAALAVLGPCATVQARDGSALLAAGT